MRNRVLARLSYANITATLALFIALGGTSYAAFKLPRSSVGAAQIRNRAITGAHIRTNAINSRHIARGTIQLDHLSKNARDSLRGTQGPVGPRGESGVVYHASINVLGGRTNGNAQESRAASGKPGEILVGFGTDLSKCQAVATLAENEPGVVSPPPPGRITVHPGANGTIEVHTFDADGKPSYLPFNVFVAC